MSTEQTDQPANELVIREVTKDVWTFSKPLHLFNRLPVGGRSTAIRLSDGTVWLLASTPLTEDTKKKLSELGEVKYIVAGNLFHHLFLKSYKDAYENAKVIGPEGLNEKKRPEGWQLDEVFSSSKPDEKYGFENEIEHCYFSGYKNKDVAFYHKASKTAIGADLLFNLPGTEQYSQSKLSSNYPIFTRFAPYSYIMKIFLWTKEEDKRTMKQDARKVADWDFDRYIPCHGNVIETDAKKAWKAAWSRYL